MAIGGKTLLRLGRVVMNGGLRVTELGDSLLAWARR